MAITLNQLIDEVEYQAGGTLDGRLDPKRIVNDAGRYLYSMHSWAFGTRPALTLQLVADQNWVQLPTDFDELLSVETSDNLLRSVHITTLDHIQFLRGVNITDSGVTHWWVALEYPPQPDTGTGQSQPRLAIYPTPSSSTTDTITLNRRAGWVELLHGPQVANIPTALESLLIELVRAHAEARVNRTPLSASLEPIEKSAMLRSIKMADGGAQSNLGQIEGGVLDGSRGSPWSSRWPTVSPPIVG